MPGGVLGGVPPGQPAPPDCCGGVEPAGALPLPGFPPGLPPPEGCAPPDPLDPDGPPPWDGLLPELEWSPTPAPAPPPGLSGGPPPACVVRGLDSRVESSALNEL